MKKYLLILILFICTLITSCTLPGQNQGNNNGNQDSNQCGVYYIVAFDSNYGSFVEPLDVKEGELVTKPIDPIKENFRFLYWTLNNVEYDFNTPVTSNITLVAEWEQGEYHMHVYTVTKVAPTCTEKGYIEYLCSCGDRFINSYIDELGHDEVYHDAKAPTEIEIGWEEYVACTRCDYSTYKEISKVTVAELEIYEENGRKYVNFGSYPQTHVADQDLINELNKLTETNERGYYEYNGHEYAKVIAKPCRYGSSDYTYSTGKTVEYGVNEWFKVEPIKWRILSNNNVCIYQVLSEYILTAQRYYKDLNYRLIDGIDIAPNNYKYSDIREFLNNSFLNSAFIAKQQESILITEVDNSDSTTASSSNSYVCENTFDNIYLLSYQDMLNTSYGFSSSSVEYDEDRRAIVTDYAKATGCWWSVEYEYLDMGYWWFRSPSNHHFYNVGVVYDIGYVYSEVGVYFSYGVRPATAIAIQ